jgi:hypothetical protein
LPYLYRAHVELWRGREVLAACERPFGIRPLGARGRRFYYEGKPWVLRAVSGTVGSDELTACHEASAALFVDNPDDDLCDAASRCGVLLVANLDAGIPANLRRLSRHAAVGFIVIRNDLGDVDPRSLAPNVVLVQPIDAAKEPPRPWAHALLCPAEQIDEHATATGLSLIAYRSAAATTTVAQRRALCDALQRDLAGTSEIAGYVASSAPYG